MEKLQNMMMETRRSNETQVLIHSPFQRTSYNLVFCSAGGKVGENRD